MSKISSGGMTISVKATLEVELHKHRYTYDKVQFVYTARTEFIRKQLHCPALVFEYTLYGNEKRNVGEGRGGGGGSC